MTISVLPEDDAVELLSRGEMELEGRLVDASNTTLRAEITLDGLTRRCVYKPVRGERPLWDFPDGTLAGREVSAYLVSQATGWNLVPPTILRDGPLGVGACQLWIDEPDDDLDRLRVRLTPEATRAFIDRARRVVAAGRPPCPLCGQPLDPAGHLCPRHNGYHR